MKYDTVIFDLDGTLLNTLEDLYLSVNYALEKFNYSKRSKEEIRCFLGNGVKILIDSSLPNDDKTQFEAVMETFKTYYQLHSMEHISKYEGIDDLIKELKQKEIKIAVVTNKFDQAAKTIINKFFGNVFEIVIGEKAPLNKKPHPDMCYKALELLNSDNKHTIYVGDSEVDYQTATNASLKPVICSWGFRTKEELRLLGDIDIINTPKELLKYF